MVAIALLNGIGSEAQRTHKDVFQSLCGDGSEIKGGSLITVPDCSKFKGSSPITVW